MINGSKMRCRHVQTARKTLTSLQKICVVFACNENASRQSWAGAWVFNLFLLMARLTTKDIVGGPLQVQ